MKNCFKKCRIVEKRYRESRIFKNIVSRFQISLKRDQETVLKTEDEFVLYSSRK